MAAVENHRKVQAIAKTVLSRLAETITSSDTERTIARRAMRLLSDHGITETWYYECAALVLLGSRRCLSVSGQAYRPSNEKVGLTNLITVDLSPSVGGVWGDCARSFFIENGSYVHDPTLPEFAIGVHTQLLLQARMRAFVTPATTYNELFEFANAQVRSFGFENLDYLGNLGHSIESELSKRRYIEAGNDQRLESTALFTFEPHIRHRDGVWGFKHENIYYFSNGVLQEL